MSKPVTNILKEKLKEKSHLLYKIQQKHEHWGVAKCTLLIGAGCSYPTLPLGTGLIDFCKQLCYIKDVFPKDAAKVEKDFLANPEAKLLDDFINKTKDSHSGLTFDQFITQKEEILRIRINENQEDELKKIPDFFKDPDWNDFEHQFWNDAKYGYWMDAYNSSPRERQRLIEALIENCNPGGAYIILALLIEMKYLNNILTTNFDDFINDTLLYYTTTRPRFYADDELSQFITIHSPKPNIIKLHGDYRYANLKNTNKETFELSIRMEEKLRELLHNLDLIVIGYNGSDYSIMNVLQKVKSPNCELLWCDLDENNVHWRVANLINNTDNSWFIKIKGFDDIIKDFYLEFVKTPPDLLTKAQTRQEEISRYVKEYNKELQEKAESPENKATLEKQEYVWELYSKAVLQPDVKAKIDLFTEALASNPQNEYVLIGRGLAYKEIKENDNAIQDLNTAIELNPTLALAYLNRGYLLEEVGKYSEAINDFDKAAELGFENKAMLYNNYAVAYRRTKNFEKAIQYVELGLKNNPTLYHLYGTLALIYSDKEDDEKFYKYIEICLQNGCPIYKYLDEDSGFDRFKNTEKFKILLKKYNPGNTDL